MVYLAIEFLISCVASFAVFFPSLKTLIEDTDRLSCLLYMRGQRSLGTCSDEITKTKIRPTRMRA